MSKSKTSHIANNYVISETLPKDNKLCLRHGLMQINNIRDFIYCQKEISETLHIDNKRCFKHLTVNECCLGNFLRMFKCLTTSTNSLASSYKTPP